MTCIFRPRAWWLVFWCPVPRQRRDDNRSAARPSLDHDEGPKRGRLSTSGEEREPVCVETPVRHSSAAVVATNLWE